MSQFHSVLVANRGEIAVRILRTVRSLGMRGIAVYSDADADAPHVRLADDRAPIGGPSPADSYLNIEHILEAARRTGAEAIHPGYGFLAENAAFARACIDAGLVWIGPGPDAIEIMGNKAEAKRRMIEAGVPCVPGYEGDHQATEVMVEAAERIGFPIMVKAAAGGGGRGMRLVDAATALSSALDLARSEAENAFGSGELILEKAILRPRHVEIQVFADAHGTVIHLGERDCSVQRRHQKVIEEAPCPVMTADLRERMGAAAVEAARSIGYQGAGTVEFLLDQDREFYFLEINTRLQVEHPVTELVTGLDLVALQFTVAQGEPLGLAQSDIQLRGHAIEVRLYAEDPAQEFLPSAGHVDLWKPAPADGVRYDAGITSDQDIPPFYDPMIAKVIAWGAGREVARGRLIRALRETAVFGLTTNRRFLIDALRHPTFADGAATTAFIPEEFPASALAPRVPAFEDGAGVAVIQYELDRSAALGASLGMSPTLLNWSNSEQLSTPYRYALSDGETEFIVAPRGADSYTVSAGEESIGVRVVRIEDGVAILVIGDRQRRVNFHVLGRGRLSASTDTCDWEFRNLDALGGTIEAETGGGRVVAPMHGQVLQLCVKQGDTVTAGTALAVLEAMKMQHEIIAQVDGVVREVLTSVGAQVAADDLLIVIDTGEE